MVQGTTSLLSNTVYAFSDATTQFSKAARKVFIFMRNFSNQVALMHQIFIGCLYFCRVLSHLHLMIKPFQGLDSSRQVFPHTVVVSLVKF